MASLGYVVYLLSTSSKGARHVGSKLVVVWYTSGELFTLVPNRFLCSPTDTSLMSSTGAFLETTKCHLPGSISGENYRYKDYKATLHHAWVVPDFFQQGNVTKREKPATSPDCTPWNIHVFGMNWALQSPVWTTHPRILVNAAKPCLINGQKPL